MESTKHSWSNKLLVLLLATVVLSQQKRGRVAEEILRNKTLEFIEEDIQDDAEIKMLTTLTWQNFHKLIEGRDWLINVCHSRHWECKQYNKEFKEKLMFPLREQLSDRINLGYVDTYEWNAFESDFHSVEQPKILYIRNGTHFHVYRGDPRSLRSITHFAEKEYKSTEQHQVPTPLSTQEIINKAINALKLGLTRGPQKLMTGLGLGEFHWGVQVCAVTAFIFLQYLIVRYLFKDPIKTILHFLEIHSYIGYQLLIEPFIIPVVITNPIIEKEILKKAA